MARSPGRPTLSLLALAVATLLATDAAGDGRRAVLLSSRDATLFESATGALADGAGPHLRAGRTAQGSGSIRRALVAFDVAGIVPPGSRVTGVALILALSSTSAGSEAVAAHRIRASWGEGASSSPGGQGAPATRRTATWVHRFYDRFRWKSSGGDFVGDPSAVTDVDGVGVYVWQGPGMIADVQLWLDDPRADHGWLLAGNEALSQTVKRFDAREVTPPGIPPLLVVDFVLPPDDDDSDHDEDDGRRATDEPD